MFETRTILEIFGWTGSLMVICSLILASQVKFRWYNLIGSLIATIYNAILAVWPFMAMNAAIVLIDAYWLWRLDREAKTHAQHTANTSDTPQVS
ncbi:hypothetical protein [Trueperella sp. LYQ143]|uniref:hypothetical protein n=1 Tax=unclassified Trueperella TaxID=2630174 RepID=UPI0039837D45